MRRISINNWILSSIGDLCDVKGGDAAPQNKSIYADSGLPFIRMQDVGRYHQTAALTKSIDCIPEDVGRQFGLTVFPVGSILLPRSGSVYLNHRAVLGTPSFVVSHLAVLIVRNNAVLVDYLYYYLCAVDMRMWSSKTTGLDSISFSSLKAIEVPIPPPSVQQRIVQILQKADEIRRKRQEAMELADAILPAIFISMFGDPANNQERFERSPLGKVADVRSGVTKGRKLRGKKTIEVPYLRVANVQDG